MKNRLVVAAFGIVFGVVSHLTTQSAEFLGEVEGRFTNPMGPESMVVSGMGTAEFQWGILRPESSVPSQMVFRSESLSVRDGVEFRIGTLEYSNGITEVRNNPESVDLEIVIDFGDGLPSAFQFPLALGTTLNSSNSEDSADSLLIGDTTSDTIVLAGGGRFILRVDFGNTTADGYGLEDQFNVFENSVASVEMVGILTRVDSVEGFSAGGFANPIGPSGMVVAGEDTEDFFWGRASGDGEVNRIRFEGLPFVADTELPFTVGRFEYFNGSIASQTTADSVDLFVTLDLPGVAQESFVFPLNIITTSNSSNGESSADIIELARPFAERMVDINDVPYGLRIAFGNTTEEGFSEVDRFFVFEDASATAELRAELTRFIPQSEPDMGLEIVTAVELKFRTFPGISYQVQSSIDLVTWENEGEPIEGTGRLIERFYSVEVGSQRTFRVSKTEP